MKNPMTLAVIEPATFRFVAQHLNHCATAVPQEHLYKQTKKGGGESKIMKNTLFKLWVYKLAMFRNLRHKS